MANTRQSIAKHKGNDSSRRAYFDTTSESETPHERFNTEKSNAATEKPVNMDLIGSIQLTFMVKNSDNVWRIMIVWLMQMATETVFILTLVTSTLAKNAIPTNPQLSLIHI
eukprot:4426081-Pyramimonas_sp.AAC.1